MKLSFPKLLAVALFLLLLPWMETEPRAGTSYAVVWWVLLIIVAAQYALSALLQPKPEDAKPEDIRQAPTSEEALPVPVVWGTVIIKSPNVLWSGDVKAEPIKKRIFNGLFFRSFITGYKYHIGLIMGLCYGETPEAGGGNPVGCNLRAVYVDERPVWEFSGSESSYFNEVEIDEPTFFGAEKQQGGVFGKIVFHAGKDRVFNPQEPSAYWEGQVGLTLPNYKGICYVEWEGYSETTTVSGKVKHHGYVGNTGNLPPFAFKVRRIPHRSVSLDIYLIAASGEYHANPIEALYECFTNEDFGMGEPAARINTEVGAEGSFFDASDTVADENLAFSYLWDRQSSVEEMAGEILKYVDGAVYTDLATGKICVKLARDDYDAEAIPSLTNEDFVEITELSRSAISDQTTELKVSFTDHATAFHDTRAASALRLAIATNVGLPVSSTVSYPMCPDATLAQRLAERDLKALSANLWRLAGKIDRTAYNFAPYSVFKFTWDERGIEDVVMRLSRINYGTLASGVIDVDAAEDVFSLAATASGAAPPATEWEDPRAAPAAIVDGGAEEIPYFMQGRADEKMRVMAYAARPSDATLSFDAYLDEEESAEDNDFSPSGALKSDYEQLTDPTDTSDTLVLEDLTDESSISTHTTGEVAAGANLALLVGADGSREFVNFTGATLAAGELTLHNVGRGLLDTPPRAHTAGARLYVIHEDCALCADEFLNGVTVDVALATKSLGGAQALADATEFSVTTARRAERPYPVRYVRINGSYTTVEANTATSDTVITWRESNRLTESTIVKQDATSGAPEASITYTVKIYQSPDGVTLGTLLRTYTGITLLTQTYSAAQEAADTSGGSLNPWLIVEVTTVRDGLACRNPWRRPVSRPVPEGEGLLAEDGDFLKTEDDQFITLE